MNPHDNNHNYIGRTEATKDNWLTPPDIPKRLGHFDLDPASPANRPWSTADKHYTEADDGLTQQWQGRVWLNPPYGRQIGRWLDKLCDHGNGIALVTPRTETAWFFRYVWGKADAIFFFRGRLSFYHEDGTPGSSSTTPSCLIAYGKENAQAILKSGLDGCLVMSKNLKLIHQGLN